MIAEVIVDVLNVNVDKIYDYILPDNIDCPVGSRVMVNFAGRYVGGIVVGVKDRSEYSDLKSVVKTLDDKPVLSGEMISLMWHMSKKNHMLLADVLRLFIPSEMRNNMVAERKVRWIGLSENADLSVVGRAAKKQAEIVEFFRSGGEYLRSRLLERFSLSALDSLIEKGVLYSRTLPQKRVPYKSVESASSVCELTEAQDSVVHTLLSSPGRKFLLHGVTGSGKTEVYMRIIADCVERGKTAIMLVPEIALTPQMLGLFRGRFGDSVAILHSGLSAGERFDEWWRLKNGDAKIAVGARSAIFAPLEDVGVIIVDEEHEQSYVPDNGKFTTSDVAEFRSEFCRATLIYGSATPSVGTFYRAKCGELTLLTLSDRINKRAMPEFRIVDMRRELKDGNNGVLSSELKRQLDRCLAEGNQAMLFINRRGYSPVVMCAECGYVAKCADCDVTLTYHREEGVLKCHYCDKRFKLPDVCPQCGGEHIRQKGLGTERVVHELQRLYPDKKFLRMDNDTTSNKEGHSKIVSAFSAGAADVLVGTQMIAKGHDFKNVALVGILDADQSLYFSDYRSTERTFQLITQVAGRAGRAETEGVVILQTHSPKHYIYTLATRYDYEGFYSREIALREATNYPPFAKIVRISFSSEGEAAAIDNLKRVYGVVCKLRDLRPDDFIYLNRMRSPVKRIQKKYRYQILMRLKSAEADDVISELYKIVDAEKDKKVASFIEVDPGNLS